MGWSNLSRRSSSNMRSLVSWAGVIGSIILSSSLSITWSSSKSRRQLRVSMSPKSIRVFLPPTKRSSSSSVISRSYVSIVPQLPSWRSILSIVSSTCDLIRSTVRRKELTLDSRRFSMLMAISLRIPFSRPAIDKPEPSSPLSA